MLLGGYCVRFWETDLSLQVFRDDVDLGPGDGHGVPVLLHHGHTIHKDLAALTEPGRLCRGGYGRLMTSRDDVGVWGAVRLDAEDRLHRTLFELAGEGCIGWSVAALGGMIRREAGLYRVFWMAEASLTPQPCLPRCFVRPVSIEDLQQRTIQLIS